MAIYRLLSNGKIKGKELKENYTCSMIWRRSAQEFLHVDLNNLWTDPEPIGGLRKYN